MITSRGVEASPCHAQIMADLVDRFYLLYNHWTEANTILYIKQTVALLTLKPRYIFELLFYECNRCPNPPLS